MLSRAQNPGAVEEKTDKFDCIWTGILGVKIYHKPREKTNDKLGKDLNVTGKRLVSFIFKKLMQMK